MLSIIQAAGWPIWPLIACSVLGLALIFERFLALKTARVAPPKLLDEAITVSSKAVPTPDVVNQLAQNSALGEVLASGLRTLNSNPQCSETDLRAAMEGTGRAVAYRLEKYLSALATIASAAPLLAAPCAPAVRIAVARDEAFCFAYAETLDALRDAGAELVFFSPLRDAALPENIRGLYLPGGYPELYARQLSENCALRAAIREAVQMGLPTAAECGGFLYLGQALEGTDGKVYPMAGALPGSGHNAGRLVRFGYAAMTAKADSMLFRTGEALPIHEFHHWDSSENGTDFSVRKTEKRQWKCGFANAHLYAGFPHLYWAGTALPRRFVQAAQHFLKHKG